MPATGVPSEGWPPVGVPPAGGLAVGAGVSTLGLKMEMIASLMAPTVSTTVSITRLITPGFVSGGGDTCPAAGVGAVNPG